MLSKTKLQRDFEGYILDPEDWSRDLARALAAEESLELNRDYWQILDFMREYWFDHRVAPDVRHVVEFLMNQRGYDKQQAKRHLFELFPYGYVKQACKIAGMQHPRAWSTG
jgi:tRNA 2-thiouridine synthesizing protein E